MSNFTENFDEILEGVGETSGTNEIEDIKKDITSIIQLIKNLSTTVESLKGQVTGINNIGPLTDMESHISQLENSINSRLDTMQKQIDGRISSVNTNQRHFISQTVPKTYVKSSIWK